MKEHVDLIIKGKYIITLGGKGVITDGAIAVKDKTIVDVDKKDNILGKYSADEVIERPRHIIVPGFVDCHTHTQQLFLRSAITDVLLQLPPVWTKLLIPFEKKLGEDLARLSSIVSIINMLKNGITYFVEACAPYPEVLAEAVKETGIKGVVTYAIYDILEGEVLDTKSVLKRAEELYRRYGRDVRVWMSLRQVMMATDELINGVLELCKKYRTGLTIHLAEYQGEIDFTLAKSGLRALKYIESEGFTSIKPLVIAHGVFLSPEEIELVRRNNIGVCWCPTVDSWIMGPHWAGYTRIDNILLSIGSDGGVWSTLDLLHEVKIARAVGKSVSNALTYTKVTLDSTLALKAITGVQGGIVQEKIGVIEKGYSADLTVLSLESFKYLPVNDPIELTVNFLEGDSVSDVFIDGKHVVKEGKVVVVDEKKVYEELLNKHDKIVKIINELKTQLLSKYVKT